MGHQLSMFSFRFDNINSTFQNTTLITIKCASQQKSSTTFSVSSNLVSRKACSAATPFLSRLVERYQFAQIVLHAEFSPTVCTFSPMSAAYNRVLENGTQGYYPFLPKLGLLKKIELSVFWCSSFSPSLVYVITFVLFPLGTILFLSKQTRSLKKYRRPAVSLPLNSSHPSKVSVIHWAL